MDKILTGSTAILYNDFNYRNTKDRDYYIHEKSTYRPFSGIDYLYNPIIFKYKEMYDEFNIMNLYGMFNVKLAHIFFNHNWSKHLKDLEYLLKYHNEVCKVNNSYIKEVNEFYETEISEEIRTSLTEKDINTTYELLNKYNIKVE